MEASFVSSESEAFTSGKLYLPRVITAFFLVSSLADFRSSNNLTTSAGNAIFYTLFFIVLRLYHNCHSLVNINLIYSFPPVVVKIKRRAYSVYVVVIGSDESVIHLALIK